MKNHKVILAGGLAKRLITRGHYLCDLKPKRENPQESCYIFFVDKWLEVDINDIMNNAVSTDIPTIKQRIESLGISEKQYKKYIFNNYLQVCCND